jgi:hypothetical protein
MESLKLFFCGLWACACFFGCDKLSDLSRQLDVAGRTGDCRNPVAHGLASLNEVGRRVGTRFALRLACAGVDV